MIDRARSKKLVEGFVVGSGACGIGIRMGSQRSLVLAYHNVVPEGQDEAAGERSLHLPRAAFVALDRLMETDEVVPVERIGDPVSAFDRASPSPSTMRTRGR